MKFGKYTFTNINISPEAENYFKNIQPTKQNVLLAELVDGILRIEKDIKTVNKTNVTLLKQLYDSAKSIENQIYFISGRQQVMFIHKHIKNIESAAGIYCDCVNDKLFDLIQFHSDKNGGIVRKEIASKITYKAFKTAYPELIRKIDASGQEYFIDPYTQKHYRLEEGGISENKEVDEVLASGGQIAKEKFESEALKSMIEGGFVPVVDVSGEIQKPLSKQVIITSSQVAIKVFSDNLKKQNWKGDYCVCILLRTNNSVVKLLYMPKSSPIADSKAQEVFYREFIGSLARGMILISSSESGNYISSSDIKSINTSFVHLSAKLLDVITYNPKNDRFVSYSDAGKMAKGGGILLAPNGNPSNLTAEQYKLVRTPEFKAWFGDWENDPENASKVVDENGEPLVCCRGNLISQEQLGYEFNLGRNLLKKQNENQFGFFFTSDINVAKKYMLVDHFDEIIGGSITSVFIKSNKVLNLLDFDLKINQDNFINGLIAKGVSFDNNYNYLERKIRDFDTDSYKGWGYNVFDYFDVFPELRNLFIENGFMCVLFYEMSRTHTKYKVYVPFESSQIKLADGSNTTFDSNNPDIRFEIGGSVLLAPNGKPSNLTLEQYKLVRTPEFKAWFGDWENDPADASKVVDENGEPLVCYHTSNKKFTKFNYKLSYDGAIWFTENIQKIINNETGAGKTGVVYEVFLDIKKMGDWDDYDKGIAELLRDKFNGSKMDDDYIVFESNQIKLADGTNTTFDGNNPDIRFEQGGRIDELISKGVVELKIHKTTTAHAKEYGIESRNPLYVQSIYVSEHSRLAGTGKRVLEYIDEYAIKNGHDVIFGHISTSAKLTKDNRETLLSDIDIIKNWLRSKGYQINSDNNDFYKIVRYNNYDVRLEEGGKVTPKGYELLSDEIKPMILSDSNSVTSVKVDVVDFQPVSNTGTDITEKHIFTIIEFWNKNRISIVEECVLLFEDENRNPVALYRHSLGGISSAIIESILIAHVARLVNAKYCIMAHNHPSGNKNPSGADKTITYNLTMALNLVKCQLKDAVIILPDNTFVSFYNEIPNNFMKKGGQINRQGDDNAEMALNQNLQIRHHTEELEKIIKSGKKIPAWIVSKMSRAADSISDATHYLDGTPLTYEKGGRLSDKDRLAELVNALDSDLDDDIKSVVIAEIEEINIRIKSQNPVDNFNAEDAEKAFRVLSDTAHYAGVYESTPDSVQIEWGKYGYSVSESYYESDLEMLYRAKNIFNSKYVGKMIASVHRGDKFITVRIISYNKLVNEVEEIQKAADNKEVVDYIKENYATEAVSMYFEMIEAKNKKAKLIEENRAKISQQCGFEVPQVWFDSFEKAKKRSPLYSDYKLVIRKSQKASKKTDSAKELFAYAQSAEVLNEMKGNRTVTVLLYYPTDYIEIEVDFEKRRITAFYQTKELSPSEDITSEYLTLIKNIESAYNHILGEHIEKILDGKKYQVKNSKGQYYSVDMSTGKPKWGGAAFGYTFSWIEANSVRDKMYESSNEICEIVEYEGS